MLAKAFLIFSLLSSGLGQQRSVWSWKCVNEGNIGPQCIRELDSSSPMTLAACRLLCGPEGFLVPLPQQVSLGKKLVYFHPNQMNMSPSSCQANVCPLFDQAFQLMLDVVKKYHPKGPSSWGSSEAVSSGAHSVNISATISGADEHLSLETDESYSIKISTKGSETTVLIMAPTFFGARHALETLSQLMDYDAERNLLQMGESATIEDSPAFPYRGLIIDTSRNFFPVNTLKRILDGMSYNKLNSFHWHMFDSQSFPLHLDSLPQMAQYGAYSPEKVYTAKDVADIMQYARIRGVRVIPEFDMPAHVGHGWQWGEKEGLGKLVVCLDKQPWTSYCSGPPCGQMNLANENLYDVMVKIFEELVEMFHPIHLMHYGGDEVNLNCWNTSSEMVEWMTEKGYGLDEEAYYTQWGVFQEKVRRLFTVANKNTEVPGVLWTSTLTEKGRALKHLDKSKYVIQIWSKGDDPQVKEALEGGFKVIFSNSDALYLDYGSSSWIANGSSMCSPFNGWQDVYDNDILFLAANATGSDRYNNQVLGGEAGAWSEQIDDSTIDSKLWPRGSALAERLWTNPEGNFSTAEVRMNHHRNRLASRGLRPEVLRPEWCNQNNGQCQAPWKPKKEETPSSEKPRCSPLMFPFISKLGLMKDIEYHFRLSVFISLTCFFVIAFWCLRHRSLLGSFIRFPFMIRRYFFS